MRNGSRRFQRRCGHQRRDRGRLVCVPFGSRHLRRQTESNSELRPPLSDSTRATGSPQFVAPAGASPAKPDPISRRVDGSGVGEVEKTAFWKNPLAIKGREPRSDEPELIRVGNERRSDLAIADNTNQRSFSSKLGNITRIVALSRSNDLGIEIHRLHRIGRGCHRP